MKEYFKTFSFFYFIYILYNIFIKISNGIKSSSYPFLFNSPNLIDLLEISDEIEER